MGCLEFSSTIRGTSLEFGSPCSRPDCYFLCLLWRIQFRYVRLSAHGWDPMSSSILAAFFRAVFARRELGLWLGGFARCGPDVLLDLGRVRSRRFSLLGVLLDGSCVYSWEFLLDGNPLNLIINLRGDFGS